ncbi:uncharacterized protein Dvir_GJ26430 [Drosophila virilis]|uniref:Ionotropic glutamate receptor C-terminal domain-containing protein n=2 Tax=Drosophila virilis TaxID=7244 RepID=A0A0Q9W8X7_DROVI|nr:uncharacterized protein Dvir_GJ26430 [Drosophila virilis]
MWIIFVYKTDGILASTTILIEAFFHWCSNTNFDNVMLVLKRNNEYEIWSFEIKLRMKIFQFSVKSIGKAISQKLCKQGEMGQYRSLVAVFQSLPDAFVYNSSKNGTLMRLGGDTGLLLKSFIHHINGSMNILPLSYDEYMKKVPQDCTQDRCIDIGANMLSNFSVSPQSPVLRVTQTCLVLPYDSWIALEVYPLSFDKNYSLLAFIVLSTVVYVVIKRISNPHLSLGASLFSCLRLAAGQSIPGRTFRRLGLPEKLMEVFTHIYNLLVMSLFGSALATALITGLRKPEILDTKTFLASGLRIMVFPEQLQSLFDYIPHALSNRLIVEDESARDRHVYSLNNSYAYVMETHKWIILEFIQRRLRKPKLRLGPQALCSAQRYLTFHMRSGLCFGRALKQFTMQAHEAGLTSKKWTQLGLRQAEAAGMLSQAPYDPLIRQPLQIKFYGEAFIFYSFSLFLSLITLVLECLYAYCRTRNTVIIV